MSLINERTILVVIFDDRTTIGMVRLYSKETAEELNLIFEAALSKGSHAEEGLSDDFANSAESKLDDIFQD